MAETSEEEEHVSSLPPSLHPSLPPFLLFFLPILTRGLGHDGQSGHVRKKHCDLGVHRVRNNKIHILETAREVVFSEYNWVLIKIKRPKKC